MDVPKLLYRIDRIVRTILYIVTCCLATLLMLACIGISYRIVWYGFGAIFCLCVIVRICLSPFVKSDEEEEFEQKVNYILEQKAQQHKQVVSVSSDYSPLCNLSAQQEKQIIQILHDLPSHSDKPDYINLALIARYLTALEQLNKINLSNRTALRAWVANVTAKTVPSSSQFNEAIPNKNRSEVAKVRRQLEKLLGVQPK